MEYFDFKTDKSDNTVLIDMNSWVENDSNLIQSYRLSGRQIPTYITKVLDTNIVSDKYKNLIEVKDNDYILLTKAVSELANFRSYTIKNRKYYNVPITHIIGVFKDNKITIDTLKIASHKVIVEEVKNKEEGFFYNPNSKSLIGKVIKTNSNLVSVGAIVLIKDNVSTPIVLNGKKYYSTEEQDIVGIFESDDNYTIKSITLINESVLMLPGYQEQDKDSVLIKPDMNYEDEDYSDIYNRNIFSVIKADKKLTKISEGDIIITNRDATCYVYLEDIKYFITNSMENIEGKIN